MTNCECIPNLDNIITIGTNQPLNRSVSYIAGLINCRSAVNKTTNLKVELADHNLHICTLTETWSKEVIRLLQISYVLMVIALPWCPGLTELEEV